MFLKRPRVTRVPNDHRTLAIPNIALKGRFWPTICPPLYKNPQLPQSSSDTDDILAVPRGYRGTSLCGCRVYGVSSEHGETRRGP